MKNLPLRSIASIAACLLSAAAPALGGTLEDIANEFSKLSNNKTPFGVSDGNPQAATAFLATDAYAHFGIAPSLNQIPQNNDSFQLGLSAGGSYIDTGSISESVATLDLYFACKLTDTVGLAVSLPGEYRQTGSADTYIGGINVGLPITLLPPADTSNTWTLTPWLTAASASFSPELVQGSYVFGGGITSNYSHRTGAVTVTLADQIGYDVGVPIAYSSESDFEQNVSQFILKNGVKLNYDFDRTWFADAGVTYTNFLKGAYTDNYFSVFTGIGAHMGPAGQLRVGYVGDADFANNYYTYGGEINLYFAF